MIYSRYLSDTRRVKFPLRWLSDLARRAFPFSPTGQEPFTRLKFWKVRHQLIHRLAPYEATQTPSMFRTASWNTLVWWALFLDEEEAKMVEQEGATV